MNAEELSRVRALAERWWVPVVRGCVAILFGIALLASPGIGLYVLVLLWGAFALADGVINLAMAARRDRRGQARGWLVLEGVVSIAAGVVALGWPGITAFALLMVIAAWAVVTGVAELVAAFRLGRRLRHGWMLGLAGILSIVFGLLLFAFPGSGALALMWTIGAYAIVFGAVLVGFGLELRRLHRGKVQPMAVTGAPTPEAGPATAAAGATASGAGAPTPA